MTDFENLVKGQRYMFHYKDTFKGDERMAFRATFVHLFEYNKYKTLIVNKKDVPDPKTNKAEIWYLAMDLMSHYETLPDILINEKCILPDDVLLEIDNYF